ncbi:MAG: hypothetical protein J6S63_01295 [Atopobiaceae bacterium]|nr:hypothetical protein [Atopobiaceae bacterium]
MQNLFNIETREDMKRLEEHAYAALGCGWHLEDTGGGVFAIVYDRNDGGRIELYETGYILRDADFETFFEAYGLDEEGIDANTAEGLRRLARGAFFDYGTMQ